MTFTTRDLLRNSAAACAALGLLALATTASAQSADREGRWEASAGLTFLSSSNVNFEGGTTADVDSDTGFKFGVAYHLTDHLKFGGTLSFSNIDYRASIAGDEAGEFFDVRGELDTTTLMADATYHFLDGPFTPFVLAGIGWNWTDTNIADEPPEFGCWWDPWWGYVCTNFQDTRTIDGFAYQVGAGARYDFGNTFAVEAAYRVMWVDYDNATSTPDFDAFELNFGWKF